ncbi:fimbrial protein [Serratia ureilytica]|uniref:fimbrial protein n=1 Tax=Serratia ureilytica TaxID=300181 RepID=UPI0018D7E864|nr:fimbrial protein [Serratia ureilytica]MBH3008160.1 type 1 fimbrial protein [Serratia ureilytica]MBH3022826.1 type 1 fimbrial protein [Serratia ureilytica]MBH3108705.1 type 1 fimbrial protein [Serratia ureilytica]MBH3176099.1 type 1 fimbrial protein [Serratia ureilytica]QQU62272.1 type 1 fimbrial protein [Serratia ureilytica]
MKRSAAYFLSPFILLVLLNTLAQAQAAHPTQGWGRVNMQGAIIDTACAIATGSREQTIDMDSIPVGDIMRDGQGTTRSFSIELIHCELSRPTPGLPDWKQFQVTFDGEADGALFGVQGEAKGVGLEITDSQGNKALPGEPMPLGEINRGAMKLDYVMKLVSNNQVLKAGGYTSAIRFKLDYY